jgi:hypothetical protein
MRKCIRLHSSIRSFCTATDNQHKVRAGAGGGRGRGAGRGQGKTDSNTAHVSQRLAETLRLLPNSSFQYATYEWSGWERYGLLGASLN